MRCLTVQQPWAYAIFHGKTVENRTQQFGYRGPLAIHAGARLSERGCDLVPGLLTDDQLAAYADTKLAYGAVIGVVDLVDVHDEEPGCCDSPWAESSYVEAGGKVRRRLTHLVLERPVLFDDPIPARGMLGLWRPPQDLEVAIAAQLLPDHLPTEWTP